MKKNIVNRNHLKIAKVPQRYFLTGILIITITLATYLLTGSFLRYSDEYRTDVILSQQVLFPGKLRIKSIPPEILEHISLTNKITLNISAHNKSEFRIFKGLRIDKQKGLLAINLSPEDERWIKSAIKTNGDVISTLVFRGAERSLFSRLLESKKKQIF